MATGAKIGHGSIFAIGDGGSPEVFTALAEVTALTGPNMTKDSIDATHMASPERYREFVGGLKDPGEVTVTMNFVPGGTDEDAIRALFDADVPGNVRITWPGGEAWIMSAFCASHEFDAPLDDKMSATANFKLTGKPAFFG